VLKTMLLNKLKFAAAVLFLMTVVGVGAGGLRYRALGAETALAPPVLSGKPHPKRLTKADNEQDFIETVRQVEKVFVPFPDDKQPPGDPNLGFYPPAKVLVEKIKEEQSRSDARQKALDSWVRSSTPWLRRLAVKSLAIAEIEASLKKLKASTDDRIDLEELAKIEKAIRAMREDNKIISEMVYPLKDLKAKEPQEKK
jgi:hypothetical protein